MLGRHALACSLLLLATGFCCASLLGCKRDLGECNLAFDPDRPIEGPAAFDIAYRITDGLPMYEGQALVQSTCGDGSFCHAPAAVGADRIGVPAGLNFDVDLACTDESQDPSCAQPIESCEGGQTDTAYCSRLESLHNNQNQVNSFAEGMIQEMRAGAMPPGEAGRRVRNNTPWLRKFDPDRPNRPEELPPIESTEAQEIVRNWLACQAPVVARTEIPTSDGDELEECPSVDGEICIYSGPAELPDPVWNDIYWSVMFTQCVPCHAPDNPNLDQNPDRLGEAIPGGLTDAVLSLDLSGESTTDTSNWADGAYPAVVDAMAAAQGVCGGANRTIVIPFDSAGSLMIEKMRDQQDCGDEMPPGQILSEPIIQVVEQWIDMGALNN
jgi:hypothetical protein